MKGLLPSLMVVAWSSAGPTAEAQRLVVPRIGTTLEGRRGATLERVRCARRGTVASVGERQIDHTWVTYQT